MTIEEARQQAEQAEARYRAALRASLACNDPVERTWDDLKSPVRCEACRNVLFLRKAACRAWSAYVSIRNGRQPCAEQEDQEPVADEAAA